MRIFLIYMLLCLLPGMASSNPVPKSKSVYVTVKAADGDGVYSLLRKYRLLDDPSNLKLFYSFNKLKPNVELIKGKTYKLPLTIHNYDGKSIKSSMGWKDAILVKGLENYNQFLSEQKLKSGFDQKAKKIYVPEKKQMLQGWSKIEQTVVHQKNPSEKKSTNLENAPGKGKIKETVATKQIDRKQQFLIAGMGKTSIESKLVADRKLSLSEIRELEVRLTANSKSLVGSAVRASSNTLKVPLFGKKYESVEIKNESLSNQVFYIVPGHGGPDPGAIAKNVDGAYTICEDEYAYDVSLRLAKNLMEQGAIVYIIVEDENDGIRDEMYLECDQDETNIGGLKIPVNQKKRLKQGITKVNKLYKKYKKKGYTKQWMLSLHIDAQSEVNRQDVFFYYQSESQTSKNKAIDIQKVFEDKYQVYRKNREYDGTVSARPLYVVRNSDPEPVFIELANIHNPEDRKRILFPKNRQLLADWITEGFMN
ncbi:MAG: N-acetylmuramoyl-L-alanine amidase [Saprospiraceae bacterium]|nr:N-acetylmuramoyl-L-alanine amidase [Saprospiraceae bacterium]